MNKLLFILFFTITGCEMNSKQSKIEILPLSPFEETQTVNDSKLRYKFFLINRTIESDSDANRIKTFACSQTDSSDLKLYRVTIMFYLLSDKLPKDFRQKSSDLLAWHGDDLRYEFSWYDGHPAVYRIHKNDGAIKSQTPFNCK